jgi:GntR family transcriptional regulator/MocR family aminotransferase
VLEATRRAGVPILEDDYDHEHHFRASPALPLASGAPHVIYVSTLSKVIAPGIRIGLVAASEAVIERLVRLRRMGNRGNDGVTQAAVAAWIEDGGFERHLRRARTVYRARRDAAFSAVERACAEGCAVSCRLPDGGLALWTQWDGVDTYALALRARRRGVLVVPERLLRVRSSAQPRDGARLAFSRLAPAELGEAISLLVEEARALRSGYRRDA